MATLEQAKKDIRLKRGLDEPEPEVVEEEVEEVVAEEPAAEDDE